MQGIICDTHPAVRDEAPQAYKDLGKAGVLLLSSGRGALLSTSWQVLKNQAELVEAQSSELAGRRVAEF